ncbi:MAG: TIGR03560 family F420-dependent LLM class oxidoreductase [Chloroflexota bacterium]
MSGKIEAALMIEGQDGLTWPRWQRLAQAAEQLGFAGLYRSDHFTNADGPDQDSLELWVSLAWLAAHTRRIEFGPLVTPVSFRHPALTARMAAAVDDLSGGRLTLGVGAGWQAREHEHFGFDLLDVPARFARFEEGLEVITRLLRSDQPVDFAGDYYLLKDALLLPRPARPGGPPLLIGGNGPQRTLPLAARYADEWNAVFTPPQAFAELSARLDDLLVQRGRRPEAVRRSLMTTVLYGRDAAALQRRVERYGRGQHSPDELRRRGLLVGTAEQIAAQIEALGQAGVQRVMLQWLEMDDLDGLEAVAQAIYR